VRGTLGPGSADGLMCPTADGPRVSPPLIHGVCPIVATPFTDDGAVDYDSIRNQVRVLAEGGCHAAALFGVASEFFKLTDDERDRMAEVVADEAGAHDLPLVLSVTHEATEVATERAAAYEAAGADCIMVLPPSTLGPPQGEVVDHLAAVGEAVSVPVMVQYRPPETPTMPPETLVRLGREVPNVDYFKIETDPSGPYSTQLIEETDGEANVLVGSAGKTMVEALDRGAVGVIPASFAWDVYVDIYEAYGAGDRERAIDLHDRLLPILNRVDQASLVYEKRILARRGVIETDSCRHPRNDAPDEVLDDLLETHYERLEPLLDEPK